jgi:hypothetical protein
MAKRSLSNSLFSLCSSCLAYLFISFLPSFPPSFHKRVQIGYHELALWVIAYWVFILKYSWNLLSKSFLKNLEKSWNFSSHYYVMVYIKNLLRICHCQKNSSPFTIPFIIQKIGYNVFKMLLGIFHSLYQFQKNWIYIPIHWK